MGNVKKKQRFKLLPLFKFGIEIEGMLCKKDPSQKDLSKLNCFYSSDWIPTQNYGKRFGVDGRDDTWELATSPHTKVSDLLNEVKEIVKPSKDWIPKDSMLLCGPFFLNKNKSGSNRGNRSSSPCGLHISLSLPDKFKSLYNELMYGGYSRGGSLYEYIQNIIPTSILDKIEGKGGIARRDYNYGVYSNYPFREKSLESDGFNGYEYRIFSSCMDELLEVYINLYLFISWIFWLRYIYDNYSNRDFLVNNYTNGNTTIISLVENFYSSIMSIRNKSFINMYNSTFFKNRDNTILYEFFDNYFGVSKKIGLCFDYLNLKYNEENNTGIKYVDILEELNISRNITDREDFCSKCLRITNNIVNRCICRNYSCSDCGNYFNSSSDICSTCNYCINCCTCNMCSRCNNSERRCECNSCNICDNYDDHISCDCVCVICPDCGEQFANIYDHLCPDCNRNICYNGSNNTNGRFNSCCGSRLRYNTNSLNNTTYASIYCIVCSRNYSSISEVNCNCGYCNVCGCIYVDPNRHRHTMSNNECNIDIENNGQIIVNSYQENTYPQYRIEHILPTASNRYTQVPYRIRGNI